VKRILTVQFTGTMSIVMDSDEIPVDKDMFQSVASDRVFRGSDEIDWKSFTVKPVSELEYDIIDSAIKEL